MSLLALVLLLPLWGMNNVASSPAEWTEVVATDRVLPEVLVAVALDLLNFNLQKRMRLLLCWIEQFTLVDLVDRLLEEEGDVRHLLVLLQGLNDLISELFL